MVEQPTSYEIPKTQKAAVVTQYGEDFKVEVQTDFPVPEIKSDEILVRLYSSGVCHSDLSAIKGSWGSKMQVQVAGHEGYGYIVKHGSLVDPTAYPLGTKVGVPLLYNPCRTCSACLIPDGEAFCLKSKFYSTHINGTWQQYVNIHSQYVIPVPDISKEHENEIGPILCGGLTVYRGIKSSQARAGKTIVVTGAGGGLGSLAIQYATAIGLRVIAIDTGADKEALTKKLGAEVFIDYAKEKDIVSAVKNATGGLGAHVVLSLAPSEASYNQTLHYLAVQGTLICIGLPKVGVNLTFPPMLAIMKGIRIIGSLVGTRNDILEALDFLARDKVHPSITVHPIEDIQAILDRMDKGQLPGRAVITFD
ncbi:alcohol dehydrogenase ADH2 [Sugiyamaella lignohabitans]|uniref:alcohol dehydrogenase n=1 Tax=Sugiyamaella lignohabitans TaxID=796027 RepID=A0A161HFI1_9ASCO|nr:alcohol dehydrogenase ADH2 [Sugiyamaella lignohabitans]ANB14290.1 alcohol dehydrogenase ADH2 [Sugiyamaella lignohabitans]